MHVTSCVQSLNVQSTSLFPHVVAIPSAYSRLGSGYGAEDIRSRFEQPYSEISAPPWESEACAWLGDHHGGNRLLFQPTKGVIGIIYRNYYQYYDSWECQDYLDYSDYSAHPESWGYGESW